MLPKVNVRTADTGRPNPDNDLTGTGCRLGLFNEMDLLLVVVEAGIVGGLISRHVLIRSEDLERRMVEDSLGIV